MVPDQLGRQDRLAVTSRRRDQDHRHARAAADHAANASPVHLTRPANWKITLSHLTGLPSIDEPRGEDRPGVKSPGNSPSGLRLPVLSRTSPSCAGASSTPPMGGNIGSWTMISGFGTICERSVRHCDLCPASPMLVTGVP